MIQAQNCWLCSRIYFDKCALSQHSPWKIRTNFNLKKKKKTIHSQIVSFLLAIGKHFLFVYNFYFFLSGYNLHKTLQFHVYTVMICYLYILWVISVQFSHSVMSDSLRPHELQHARPPCPSPTPTVHSDSRPSIQWCHSAISSSVVPFSSCPQSLPASESFPVSQHFTWYWSFSFSIIPSKEIPGLISFRMDWLDLLAVQGTLKSLLQHHTSKASILRRSAFFTVQLSHPYMTTEKTIALTRRTFVGKVMSLLLNMLSRLVITFLPRSNYCVF